MPKKTKPAQQRRVPRYSSAVRDLALALAAGEDSAFALHDALLECGEADFAAHFTQRAYCKAGKDCPVVREILGERTVIAVPPEDVKKRTAPVYSNDTPRNKRIAQDLCFELHQLGVAFVEAEYDGSGDSGTIDSIAYFGYDNKEIDLKSLPKKKYPSPRKYPTASERETTLNDLVDTVVCWQLPGGWEINEGSFGKVTIDTLVGKGNVEHSWRVETTHDDGFDFNV